MVATLVSAGDHKDPEVEAAMGTCRPKFPMVTDDMMKEICKKGFSTTNEDVKCLIKCVGEATGKADAKGVLLKDAILKSPPMTMDPAKVKDAIDGCATKMGTSDCDTAYLQWGCLVAAAHAG